MLVYFSDLYERYTNEFCEDTVPTAWSLLDLLEEFPIAFHAQMSLFSKTFCRLTISLVLAPSDLIKPLASLL